MLTPVRAASNASFSSQGQTAAIVAGGLGRSVIAPAPVNPVEAADLNSAIAGKLSILLLAARERMIEALFDAIDAAGRAISLDRGEDESNLAFASRLADAIQRLPAARIDEVERQLTEQGHSLPLRMIAAALKNPAGPEAARIVAYLEIVRYKDRDLAARAVVRSYGQNDASPMRAEARPEIQLHENHSPAAMRQPADKPSAPASALSETAALATAEEAVIAEAVDAADPETPRRENRAQSAAASAVASEESEPQEIDAAPALPVEAAAAEDARETPEAPAIQPRAMPEKGDPVIPRNWTGIVASMTEEVSEMIVTIIREQDAETVPENGPVEAAVEIDAILDDAVISDATETLIRQPAEPAAPDARAAAAPRASPVETEIVAARQPKEIAAPPMMPLPETAEAAYLPLAARMPEGFAYTQLPYQFAKDVPPNEKAGEASHQNPHHHDEAPPDQQQENLQQENQQQAQSGAGDVAADAEAASAGPQRRTPRMIDAEPTPYQSGAAADPVYALYQRMVGWE
ncbi:MULTISPECIES: hypothetical protein [unclassified Rhizobium]|uniref:hypothetical protein n=1 Tax=unclassified Rhizobium TaxID=2613769 RepID=UPI0007EADA3E|nr:MULTISPECIES: hypothetical protein [unclassified Rhizobium]ANM08553.1 hypothetical protein AMK05_CH00103 [Rhizobium sp. N324]ANM15063.1 hypothetical protein AMK06_CH00103 [Rhizobium sp. N541]ANM21451.1 hypothetical protein AMK07_CH00103 [Rhizobium sp. N941]OYD02116.1 hypothetical protein AMK08_CH100098 [Rhizobium sp. N4311]